MTVLAGMASPAVAAEPFGIVRVVDKPVSLHFTNRPLSEIAAALERQCTRRTIVRLGRFEPKIPTSIDLDKVPFWKAVAELAIASHTRVASDLEVEPDEVHGVEFCKRIGGESFDHYKATDSVLVTERIDQTPSGERCAVFDCWWHRDEMWDWSLDVYLQDSKAKRNLSILVPAPGKFDTFKIPDDYAPQVDTVAGELLATTASPLLKATIPIKDGAVVRGEGFTVSITKIKRSGDKSVEASIVSDNGRRDFHVVTTWLLDSKDQIVLRGGGGNMYDSRLGVRAIVGSNVLEKADKFIITFGYEKKIAVPFQFPLPKK